MHACRKRGKGAGWDIASMAPRLKKGQGGDEEGGPPAGAVISAAAKRYKTEDRVDSGMVTAAQIAMLGQPVFLSILCCLAALRLPLLPGYLRLSLFVPKIGLWAGEFLKLPCQVSLPSS